MVGKINNESQKTSANIGSTKENKPKHLSRIFLSKIGAFFKIISYYAACLFVLVIGLFISNFLIVSNLEKREADRADIIAKSFIKYVLAAQADYHATYKTFAKSLRELKLKGQDPNIDDDVNLEIIPIDENNFKIVACHDKSDNGFIYDLAVQKNKDEPYIKISALEAETMISEAREEIWIAKEEFISSLTSVDP